MKRTKNELILFDVLFFVLVALTSLLVLFDELFSCFITQQFLEELFYCIISIELIVLFIVLFLSGKKI